MRKHLKKYILVASVFMLSVGATAGISYFARNYEAKPIQKVFAENSEETLVTDISTEVLKEFIEESTTEEVTEETVKEESHELSDWDKKRMAQYYKDLYGPKIAKTVTIDDYVFDYIEGAPSSVYNEMARQARIKEEAEAEAQRLAELEAQRQAEAEASYYEESTVEYAVNYSGGSLTPSAGVFNGPSGLETYYNLPMDGVVSIMRGYGFSEEEYPYWIREDGVKMLGGYVMVAANLDLRPRGSVVESSLGTALVCDTGGFAYSNPTQLDIAVNW